MNSWSRTRKRIILGLVILAVMVLVGVPFFFLIYQAPTCSDGAKNGDETGVDCGGSCQRLYNAESSLKPYGVESAIPVKVIEGVTFIPRGANFALFEGPFTLEAGLVPARATLEWQKSSLVWRKSVSPEPTLKVKDETLAKEEDAPRLEAVVENQSLESISNIDLIALITDAEGNIFAASKTYIDQLEPNQAMPILFSWPRPFKEKAMGIEIIKRILPDSTFIR